jgi:hypothetical protein
VIVAIMRRLGLIRLWIVFDCASRTQRCAFHALCAPNKMPEWGINCLFQGKKTRFKAEKLPTYQQIAATGCRYGHSNPARMREIPTLMV